MADQKSAGAPLHIQTLRQYGLPATQLTSPLLRPNPQNDRSRSVLARRCRRATACIDPPGYDAGKKIKGKKRDVLVDTQGLLMRAIVHAADVQDRDGGALSEKTYGLNQLRYDLRKLKGHGLIERDRSRYAYRLTQKGIQVAMLFLFFHKRLCGPLANSRFHHQPDPQHRPNSRLEAA